MPRHRLVIRGNAVSGDPETFAGPILMLGIPGNGVLGTIGAAVFLTVVGAVIGGSYGRLRLAVT